jgi:hypothetical protein
MPNRHNKAFVVPEKKGLREPIFQPCIPEFLALNNKNLNIIGQMELNQIFLLQ